MQSQDGWTTHAVRINEDNVAYFVLPPFYTHVEHISAGTFGMVVRVADPSHKQRRDVNKTQLAH